MIINFLLYALNIKNIKILLKNIILRLSKMVKFEKKRIVSQS